MTKHLKRLFCLLLVLALSTSLFTACGSNKKDSSDDGEQASGLPDMTTDQITLTYMSWENEDLMNYLADEFMKLYPNITVKPIWIDLNGYNDSLMNYVNSGELADAFWLLGECDFGINNGLLYDMTQYWTNDPDAQNVLPTINKYKLGYYGTEYKWATPVKFFPDCIYANKALFEAENKDMPAMDWTWDEMEQSVEDMTFKSSTTGQQIFGYNDYRTIITWYPVAADPDCIGEFGWNGKEFDLTNWAIGLNKQAYWRSNGYHAPTDTTELQNLYGTTDWVAYTGVVAYQFDAWWTFNNLFNTSAYLDKGLVYVPYMIPSVDGNDTDKYIATMDFGGINAATEHPREAYELLKFMTWGAEGWKAKITAYQTIKQADGVTNISMENLPITTDEDIWSTVQKTFFPQEDDKYGRYEYFDYFFKNCKNPIPYGGPQIPGFGTFIADNYAGIEQKVFDGEDANDFVDELTQQANECNQTAMDTLTSMFETQE